MTETDNTLLSQIRQDSRQINWWLMLIPLAGLAFFVAMFWVEIALRPPKEATAVTAATQAAGPHDYKPVKPDPDFNDRYNDPFFFSLQDYMDRDYVAPVIVGLAAVIYLLAARRHRSLLCLLLGLLAVNFTFRELRDNPGLEDAVQSLCGWLGVAHTKKTWDHVMTRAVYVVAAALAVVAFRLRAWITKGARAGTPTLGLHVEFRVCDPIDRAVRADWRHTSWVLAVFVAYAVCLLVQRRAFRWWGPWEQHIHRSLEECTEDVAHAMFVVAALTAYWKKKPAQAPTA